jgi:hypothetical protein
VVLIYRRAAPVCNSQIVQNQKEDISIRTVTVEWVRSWDKLTSLMETTFRDITGYKQLTAIPIKTRPAITPIHDVTESWNYRVIQSVVNRFRHFKHKTVNDRTMKQRTHG